MPNRKKFDGATEAVKPRRIILYLSAVYPAIILFFILTFSAPISASAQLKIWEFEQIDSLQKQEPKTVVVFIKASWCRYCAAMEQSTFKDQTVINLLNTKSYFVILDAETKRDIRFQNNSYHFLPTGNNTGRHELVEALGKIKGQIALPTTTILNEKMEIIFQVDEYLSVQKFKKLLQRL